MENFFIDDKFYFDLQELMDDLDISDEEIPDLPEDWSCKLELTTLEPMFKLKAIDVAEMLYNNNEERYSEDAPEEEKIVKALKECVDWDKLNSMIPQLYYPNGKFVTITKKDLLE